LTEQSQQKAYRIYKSKLAPFNWFVLYRGYGMGLLGGFPTWEEAVVAALKSIRAQFGVSEVGWVNHNTQSFYRPPIRQNRSHVNALKEAALRRRLNSGIPENDYKKAIEENHYLQPIANYVPVDGHSHRPGVFCKGCFDSQKLYEARWVSFKPLAPQNVAYVTKLSVSEEPQFQDWVKNNNVPWQDEPQADYDMRGYWKGYFAGDPVAVRAADTGHFPDKWKTPYHKTFSRESIYADKLDAPMWFNGRLIRAVEWMEQSAFHAGPLKMEMTPGRAVEQAKYAAKRKGYTYHTDEEALADFVTVYWARLVDVDEAPPQSLVEAASRAMAAKLDAKIGDELKADRQRKAFAHAVAVAGSGIRPELLNEYSDVKMIECLRCYDESGSYACIRPSHIDNGSRARTGLIHITNWPPDETTARAHGREAVMANWASKPENTNSVPMVSPDDMCQCGHIRSRHTPSRADYSCAKRLCPKFTLAGKPETAKTTVEKDQTIPDATGNDRPLAAGGMVAQCGCGHVSYSLAALEAHDVDCTLGPYSAESR
jgi:hypothetical protein